MAGADDYKCSFSSEILTRARNELNEDPKDRMSAVEALRKWIEEQPHLVCRTDTKMLLMFLRGAKFSQLRARKMIEGNLTMHTKLPDWFQNIDTRDPKLLEIISIGYSIPLPKKDPSGSQILLYRIGTVNPNPKVHPLKYEIKAGITTGTYVSQDESVAVTGFVFIFDLTGITAKHLSRWTLDDMKKWSKAWQNNMPGRFKAFHYYNAGAFFDAMIAMSRPFLSKKFQDRIHVHDTMESLYEKVPMECLPDDYLPDDYEGPSQGSVENIIKNFKNEVTKDEFRDMLLEYTSDKYGLNESKKRKDIPAASFRKLNID